jgi:hypothetical protein
MSEFGTFATSQLRGSTLLEDKRTRSFFTDPSAVSYIQPAVLFVP